MLKTTRIGLALLLLFQSLSVLPAAAGVATDNCREGVQGSGALYLICLPARVGQEWNGDLVLFAHGYVAFNEPLSIPDLYLPDGTYLPDIINGLGYAFATTSYSTNGLAILEGVADLIDLVDIFSTAVDEPDTVYLTGGSEGGIITTLAVEQFPEVFDGGLAACGPIGDFRHQINYWGDFRVVFDYFFPGLIPGSPIDIPDEVIENWETVYAPIISSAVLADPDATDQLLNVTGASVDLQDPATREETILGLLWYNVFATNDGIAKLGGQPFGNLLRIYRGSDNDLRLNRLVQRFRAEASALNEIEMHYQTSGELVSPLVTIHTTGDPIIPYWHVPLYRAKVRESSSRTQYTNIPVLRYGHCEFKTIEVLAAFAVLVFKVTGQDMAGVENVLQDSQQLEEYRQFRLEALNGRSSLKER